MISSFYAIISLSKETRRSFFFCRGVYVLQSNVLQERHASITLITGLPFSVCVACCSTAMAVSVYNTSLTKGEIELQFI